MVVHDGPTAWEPDSGQTRLDFEALPLAEAVEEAPEPLAGPGAEEWFERGCELEDESPLEAGRAYGEAIALDPEHADAHLNLGRLLHESRDLKGAEHHYRAALRAQPDDATAAYNLGVVLEDLGLRKEALEAYEHAIAADPRQIEAHHNAVRLYEERGDRLSALRLLKSLRRLTG